jgi:hypothetical protein
VEGARDGGSVVCAQLAMAGLIRACGLDRHVRAIGLRYLVNYAPSLTVCAGTAAGVHMLVEPPGRPCIQSAHLVPGPELAGLLGVKA